MRQVLTILAHSILIFGLVGSAGAQTPTTISSSGGSVTTDVSGSTAIGITATANPASNVKVTLGPNSTSTFHIFNSSTELFRLQSNGFVGIGTVAPNRKLDIATGSDGITIGQVNDNQETIQTYIDSHWNDRTTYASGCCNGLLLQPDAGYVAIGTGSPTGSYKLEVAGQIYSSSGGFRFPDNTIQATAAGWMRNSGANQVSLSAATDSVGIGTSAPNRKLDIANGSDGITIGQAADNSQTIQTYLDGHWTDRAAYANGCCNLLLLQPDAGQVGIGTSSPMSRLEISTVGSLYPVQFQDMLTQQGTPNGFLLNMSGNGEIDVAGIELGHAGLPVIQSTQSSDLHLNQFKGASVVIGNSGNTAGLQVQSTGLSTFAGSVTVAGTLTAGTLYANYQDVAEWVPAAESLPAGTVVVLSDEVANTVIASKRAYDTGVAGVVSPKPGLLLGTEGPSKAKIATTGRVRVRVDASKNPIRMGDLLVTSDRPGMAMKSEPLDFGGARMHRPGTLIGKALEPLPNGEGEILVLLSLQ